MFGNSLACARCRDRGTPNTAVDEQTAARVAPSRNAMGAETVVDRMLRAAWITGCEE